MDEMRSPRDGRFVIGGRIAPGLTGRVVLGFIIMALGVLWTLDNLNIVESGPILRWWPVVLIALGVAKLMGAGTRPHATWGALYVIVGGEMILTAALQRARAGQMEREEHHA